MINELISLKYGVAYLGIQAKFRLGRQIATKVSLGDSCVEKGFLIVLISEQMTLCT